MFFSFSKKPRVHLYTICWNEEYMLKYFFRHYDDLVDRYIFFDDGSTDQTLSILQKHPRVEVRALPRLAGNDSYVLAAQQMHNEGWKESRGLADWVILTAVDELLYIPNLKAYLQTCTKKGVTAIPALGFQMISPVLPSKDEAMTRLVKTGCPWVPMNKLSIFNPNKIAETNHIPGRHSAEPAGEVKYPKKDELLLLHYKFLSFENTFARNADLNNKLGTVDRARGFGHEYAWAREKLKQEWAAIEQKAVTNIFSRTYNPDREHSPKNERWWRKQESAEQTSTFKKRLRYIPYQIWMKVPEEVRIQIARLPYVRALLDILRRILLQRGKI